MAYPQNHVLPKNQGTQPKPLIWGWMHLKIQSGLSPGWVDIPRYMVQEFEHFDYTKYKKLWLWQISWFWEKMYIPPKK